MRCIYPILVASLVPSIGCSYWVASRGKDLGTLATSMEVRQDFGSPIQTGVVDGNDFEDFRTHRKIAEGWKGIYFATGWVATLGLGEVIWFLHELYLATRRAMVGQTIRFVYDEHGNVKSVLLDGDGVPDAPHPR